MNLSYMTMSNPPIFFALGPILSYEKNKTKKYSFIALVNTFSKKSAFWQSSSSYYSNLIDLIAIFYPKTSAK